MLTPSPSEAEPLAVVPPVKPPIFYYEKKPEDDAALNAAQAIAGITQAASKNIPLLGISKEIAKYVMKTAEVRAKFKRMAHDQLANPITLAREMDDATNKEWRDWLPETLQAHTELTDEDVLQLDKLLAIQVALTNVDVFEDWTLFCACNSAFNHRRANFEWLDKPTYLEAAWTCHVLLSLRPNTKFGDGLLRFLTTLCIEDALVYFPWSNPPIALDNKNDYAKGFCDVSHIVEQTRKVWDSGVLQDAAAEATSVDEEDPLHIQTARLVAGQAYIKAQGN